MKAIKTITVRLPGLTWERLQELAESLEELPSETARGILKQFLANGNLARLDEKSSKTEEPSGRDKLHKLIARSREPDPSRLRKRIARNRPATMADLEELRTGGKR